MTAEISIMNKHAVALAADSALTLQEERGQKIFTSANKIFALSKYHPVGVMIYGRADFMTVPWETIIKLYRRTLKEKDFDTLKEYSSHFLKFLSTRVELFPESEQEKYVKSGIYGYFHLIRREIEREVTNIIRRKKEITAEESKEISQKVIKKHHDLWKKTDPIATIPVDHLDYLKEKYGAIIDAAKKDIFENLPIGKNTSQHLSDIAIDLFVKFPKGLVNTGISGLVIAGFGKKDIFPSLQEFSIEGITGNYLKFREERFRNISFDNDASIIPFAQSEMVATFMEGVDPNYEAAIEKDMAQILRKYPEIIIDSVDKLSEDEKITIKEELKKKSVKTLDSYITKLRDYRAENFVRPVIKVVAMLPKDELAAMAESLVNLTSFKRKVTFEAETVGGPIDVAVISKGDGFIWIKRKHYFLADLNPAFFKNYFREGRDEEE
jgi:hypothetical protein